jgi:hypothetical protein
VDADGLVVAEYEAEGVVDDGRVVEDGRGEEVEELLVSDLIYIGTLVGGC